MKSDSGNGRSNPRKHEKDEIRRQGGEMTIDARKIVTFRPSAVLKNAVNSGR